MNRRVVTWSVVGVIIIFAGLMAGRLDLGRRIPFSPLIGSPVTDMELPLLEEEGSIRLTDYKGKIVVMNFWASWCPPCREEHPQLLDAANLYAGNGVQFVAINHEDTSANATRFLDEYGRSEYQVLAIDPDSRAGIEFGVFGLPETFFIDEEGIVVAKVVGAVDLELIIEFVTQIQNGQSPGTVSNGEQFQTPP